MGAARAVCITCLILLGGCMMQAKQAGNSKKVWIFSSEGITHPEYIISGAWDDEPVELHVDIASLRRKIYSLDLDFFFIKSRVFHAMFPELAKQVDEHGYTTARLSLVAEPGKTD